jgi:hypothetical protein
MVMSLVTVTTTGRRSSRKVLMMEQSAAFHAQNMDRTDVQLNFAKWYLQHHKNLLAM